MSIASDSLSAGLESTVASGIVLAREPDLTAEAFRNLILSSGLERRSTTRTDCLYAGQRPA
jgi:hypothetical protein